MPQVDNSKKQQQKDLIEQQRQQNLKPTAKRSPSILVTDVRNAKNSRIAAPFAGHRFNASHTNDNKSPVNNGNSNGGTSTMNRINRNIPTKFSNISVSNITSGISDIPSGRKRPTPPSRLSSSTDYGSTSTNNLFANSTGNRRLTPRNIPKLSQNLPSRTSKKSQRLVLIPDDEETEEESYIKQQQQQQQHQNQHQPIDPKKLHSYQRSRAEKLTKEQRARECARVTAYLISDGFNLKMTSAFLTKHHLVQPRLYDEVLYIPYSLPLLPGSNGYRVQSNNSERAMPQKQMMENFIDKSELKDHHFEYFSGVDMHGAGDKNDQNNENNGSKPIDLGKSDLMNTGTTESELFNPGEPQFFPSPASSPVNHFKPPSIYEEESNGDEEVAHATEMNSSTDSLSEEEFSKLPNLSNHAELFIFDYGVVVFWNFSEIHEKNILADLAFAKSGDIYGEDGHDLGHDDEEEEDEEEDTEADENGGDDDDEDDEGNNAFDPDESLLVRPIHDQDIECDEFHFEYNKEISTPRIYNDMITLKSGDHLIKLTISHSLAQSTKLCYYESRMSRILTSISKLPKVLALTGNLLKIKSRKMLLIKTGKLFQLRNEVNLLSNVLDTPEFFWSIEPSLHPLYNAIRDYLEIDQRVEVINDRCKVFLDFFDIVSDSIAEKNMNKITWWVIYVLMVMILVSCIEIFLRYMLIKRSH